MKIEKLIESKIREVPDWPKKGISFKDITPLLEDGDAFLKVINALALPYKESKIDKVVGIDARGFIFASAVAYKLKTGLAIVRKKGKLPYETISKSYSLEYGKNVLEIHKDSIKKGERVAIIDDVLATGGTAKAVISLVEKLGGKIIGISFLSELSYLKGRKLLGNKNIKSLIKYN